MFFWWLECSGLSTSNIRRKKTSQFKVVFFNKHCCKAQESWVQNVSETFHVLFQGRIKSVTSLVVFSTGYLNLNYKNVKIIRYKCSFSLAYKHHVTGRKEHTAHTCTSRTLALFRTQKIIFPFFASSKMCTLMLLRNLAQSEWVQVPCKQRLLFQVFCQKESINRKSKFISFEKYTNDVVFPSDCVLRKQMCLSFQDVNNCWKSTVCLRNNGVSKALFVEILDCFSFLFRAVSAAFPLSFAKIKANNTHLHEFKLKKSLNLFHIQNTTTVVPLEDAEGLLVSTALETLEKPKYILFTCRNMSLMSVISLCDGYNDCLFDFTKYTDEISCQSATHSKCQPLYYITKDGACQKYSTSPLEIQKTKPRKKVNHNSHNKGDDLYLCKTTLTSAEESLSDGKKIPYSLVNDLVADCGPNAEDESVLKFLLENQTEVSCKETGMIACLEGHSKCFEVLDICFYSLDLSNNLQPCRNGAHLRNCLSFECHLRYKCKYNYCVHFVYLCDSKWDCPFGDDEDANVCKNVKRCNNMFNCKNTSLCTHWVYVCDGKIDCVHGDDEWICDLKDYTCLPSCNCLVYAIDCWKTGQNELLLLTAKQLFVMVSIRNSTVLDIVKLMRSIFQVSVLTMVDTKISDICNIDLPRNLSLINLSFNCLKKITSGCFANRNVLTIINLSSNEITSIEPVAFAFLPSLKIINASLNPLKSLQETMFEGISMLYELDIRNKQTSPILAPATFDGIVFEVVRTNSYQVCCFAQNATVCTATLPWYVLCHDILPNLGMQILYILMPVATTVVSLMCMIMHKMSKELQKAFCAVVVSINLNDLLSSTYLFVLWVADTQFRHNFVIHEKQWKSSFFCHFAFGVSLCFVPSAALLQFVLAFSRLRVVQSPIETAFKRSAFVVRILALSGALLLVTTLLVTACFAVLTHELPNNLCSAFIDPTNSYTSVRIIVGLTVFTEITVTIATNIFHVLLISELEKSKKKITSTAKSTSNASLKIQLLCLSLSNTLCWLFFSIFFTTLLFLAKYESKLTIWVLVFLNLNSIVNPCLFVTVALKKYLKAGA